MLSDAIKIMRVNLETGVSREVDTGLLLMLAAFELEARAMEDRLRYLTGRVHVPLDGQFVAAPTADH